MIHITGGSQNKIKKKKNANAGKTVLVYILQTLTLLIRDLCGY